MSAINTGLNLSNKIKGNRIEPMSRLRYPLENKMEYPARMVFRTIETIPPNTRGEGLVDVLKDLGVNTGKFLTERFTRLIETDDPSNQSGSKKQHQIEDDGSFSEGQADLENRPNTGAFRPTTTKLGNQTVELYLPPNIQFNDTLGYDEANLNLRGAFARSALEGGSGVFNAAGEAISAGFSGISDLINGTGTNVAEDAARAGIVRGLNVASPDDVISGVRVALQTTLNPNTKSVFRNVVPRQFQFSFKFIATSRKESREIEKIIKFFRVNAYPEHIPSSAGNEDAGMSESETEINNPFSNIPLGYTFPNRFKIAMRVKNKEGRDVQFGYKIKPCVLRTIAPNYNSTGMAFHEDGKPFEVELNLGFQEFGTLSRKDIERGF